jgi:hypothetical protein
MSALKKLFTVLAIINAVNIINAMDLPEYGWIDLSTKEWEPSDGQQKHCELLSDDKLKFIGTGRLIYKFPKPIPFKRIGELKLSFAITTIDRDYNVRVLLRSAEGGVAFWGPSHVTLETINLNANLKSSDFLFHKFAPKQAMVTQLEIRTEWNEHSSQTDIVVEKCKMLLLPEPIRAITSFRDVNPGEKLCLLLKLANNYNVNRLRCRLANLSGKEIVPERLQEYSSEHLEYQFPDFLSAGFYRLTFLLDIPTEANIGSWIVYVRPAGEIIAFDADRTNYLPEENTFLKVWIRNNLNMDSSFELKIKTTSDDFFEKRQLALAAGMTTLLTLNLPPGSGDRQIIAEVLYNGNITDKSRLRLEAGLQRKAMSRPNRFYVNVGKDEPANIEHMVKRIAQSGCGGISTPGMKAKPNITELSHRFKLPMTGEGVLVKQMISRHNLGSFTPDGICWDNADHTEDKTLLGCRKSYEELYRVAPNDQRIEIKIVEPVDVWWGVNNYEVASYSIDAIRRFRKILAGEDEGLRVIFNQRFVKRITFNDFYRFYEGRELRPAEFGFEDWCNYQPISVPTLTLPQRTDLVKKYTENQLREIQLLHLLRRYVNTQFLDHVSQFITGQGQSCGIIPSFYANITGRDYYYSYALPYLDNFYHEPFDSARVILESYDFGGNNMKRLARHFGKRQSLCLENGQPQCAVYWGTKATTIMVFAGLASLGGHDLQIDFWESLPSEKATKETFTQHKTIQDAFRYFQKYPSESFAESRSIGMITYNLREHIKFMDEFESANQMAIKGTINPLIWRQPQQLIKILKNSGARINFLRFWEIPGLSSAPPPVDQNMFVSLSSPAGYKNIPMESVEKNANREVKTSIDPNGTAMLFKGTTGEPLHLAVILDREITLWRRHYHKKPKDIPDYKTMDEMEENLQPTSPIICEVFVPIELGRYKVIDVFTESLIASFNRTVNDCNSKFTVPGIKLAGFYRIERY